MKKVLAITMTLALMFSLALAASAAGPFFDNNRDNVGPGREDGDIQDGSGLAAAVASTGGQTLVPNRQFVEGNPSAWNEENEGAQKAFDGDLRTKYGSNLDMDDYRAVWRYSDAFVAGTLILGTANDSENNHRRMDDGWTLSGSNDGSSWTVIYTGKGEDYDNENFGWFTIPLGNNTTAYSYYQILAKGIYEDASNGIQIAELELTAIPQAAPPAAEPAAVEAPAAVVTIPAVITPAPAPAASTPVAAPRTGVTASLAVLGLLGAGITFSAVRSRKNR